MNELAIGDCRRIMRKWIADGVRVQMCVTSPPYWGLRDYGIQGQLGMERTITEYVANMVEVFGMVRELLADDGTLWLNLGDSYAGSWGNQGRKIERGTQRPINGEMLQSVHDERYPTLGSNTGSLSRVPGLKPKDLCGIPWRVAFALQADGWYLRSDIIWHKLNPMPESVTDRPTKAHEYLFLLTKSERYFYDAQAIKERRTQDEDSSTFRGGCYMGGKTDNAQMGKRCVPGNKSHRGTIAAETDEHHRTKAGLVAYAERERAADLNDFGVRNKRDVWTIALQPYSAAHFATFPEALVEPCVLAGSRPGDIVLDPFMGSGTVARVAQRLGRRYLGCELNPDYVRLAGDRTRDTIGMAF